MADIKIEGSSLVVTMQGLRRLWTLKREIRIPLTHVRSVRRDPDVRKKFPKVWEKRMGTNLFRTYYGGTFSHRGEKIFWDVRRPGNAVVITLANENYQHLIVDVGDPERRVRELNRAINKIA